jgi:cytochrome subunit of sulfide dehydrogenase
MPAGRPKETLDVMSVNRTVSAVLLVLASLAAQAQTAAPAPDMVLARNLAATCANCHGTNGNARGEMKPLAGMPAEALIAVMNAYRSGAVSGTIMHQIVKGYSEEQIRLIAAYFAAQKPANK